MTQEEKKLLLKDLSARLPYGICANLPNHHLVSHEYYINDINVKNGWTNGILNCLGKNQVYAAKIEDIRPYLRPMSSMTEEEEIAYRNTWCDPLFGLATRQHNREEELMILAKAHYDSIVFLLENHFDFLGLIPLGLAIEVTESNNPYKE